MKQNVAKWAYQLSLLSLFIENRPVKQKENRFQFLGYIIFKKIFSKHKRLGHLAVYCDCIPVNDLPLPVVTGF